MPLRISILAVWGCLGLWSAVACAQTRSTTSSSSSSGATQIQATQPQSFSNNASSATTGTSASSTGGTSQTGRTNTQSGTNSANQPQFNAGDGSVGARIGQNAFVGQGGTGFAGARDTGQQANNNFTPQFNSMNDSSTTRNQTNRGTTTNLKRARPQQRIAFVYPKANLIQTQVQITQRFERLKTVSSADTSISDEGVATLTGTVADEDARKLAEALARLEPGVRSVVNQLQVGTVTP